MSKRFAVRTALLAALVTPVARAGVLIDLLGATDQTITATGPTNFIGNGPPDSDGGDGDAVWTAGEVGSYLFPSFSALGTSPFFFNTVPGNSELSGTVDWTAVEGSPASPVLIGTFTASLVETSVSPPDEFAEAFLADFMVGANYPISLTLGSTASVCSVHPAPSCLGILFGEMLTPVPEPATLAILGVALGIWLMAHWAVRRATKGPSEESGVRAIRG